MSEWASTAALIGLDAMRQQLPDEMNELSAWWYALDRDTPAKAWWNADAEHPAIARALRIDPSEAGAKFALHPFRLGRVGDRNYILAAWPCPRLIGTLDCDWLGIEQVIAWNPKTGETFVVGDPQEPMAGRLREGAAEIHASPLSFFQAWAIRRAALFMRALTAREKRWHVTVTETDELPGALLIGPLDKVRWATGLLPEQIDCVGVDARAVNSAILRAASLPRAVSRNMKVAA